MLRGVNIICFSSIDWDFIWQSHQEIMATLAAQGNRVLFVDNTGVRSLAIRDLPRLRHRIRNWWQGIKGFRQERENLVVYSPLVLPFPYSRVAHWINRLVIVRSLERWMRATGFYQPIVWTFLPTPLIVDIIDRVWPKLVVYYCTADFEQLLSLRPRRISKSERKLVRHSDVIFIQSEGLRERCTPHPNIHVFASGVNEKLFDAHVEPAPELRLLKPPLIGYVGGIHRYVDIELVERVAREVNGTVVLVGPIQTDVARLRNLDNVVFVSPQPHSRIPEFVRGFDVGIIPYLLTPYTRTVYPTKLNEYLAIGIPVVATDLEELRRYNIKNKHAVVIGKDANGFVQAIREAVNNDSPLDKEQRIQIARRHGWEARISEMSDLIERALSAREAAAKRWEESLLMMYRTARRRIVRTAAAVGVSYLLVFQTPLVWFLAEPLRIADVPRQADAIAVFAGGVGESGEARGGYQERVKHAVDLYHEGKASWLIFSSGYVFAFREAEVMRDLAADHGVPVSAIILETRARNTHENVAFVRAILGERGWHQILLVTSPYHMRRALWTWRKIAPEIRVISAPVPQSQFYKHGWGTSLEQIRGILHEYLAIALYWWNGWI